MKKISVLIALGMLMIAPWGMAQTIYDGAKLTGKDLNGTARFVGMGGAMGALGGDISTMGTNPAGIGLYRSSDVMTSFGFSLYGNESQYLGKKFNSDLTKGDFNNIGFVFSSKIGNETPLRFVNFGFNYHKAKSFNNNMRMEGNLGLYSQTYLMASQAAGIEKWGDSPYTDNGIGWLSILGADAGLIRDITIHDKTGGVNNIPYTYKDEQGKEVQYKDINGNPLYISPGHFEGMLDNGYANFRSEERGGIDQYDFNVSFNLLNSTCKCNRILINNLFKFFVWREVSKSFTRSIIEFIFNPLNLFVGYFTKVLTLWDILPDKPVGVFIGTTFP